MRRKNRFLPNPLRFDENNIFYRYEKEEDPNAAAGGGGETKLKDSELAGKKPEIIKVQINGVTQELTPLQVQQLVDLGVTKFREMEEAKANPPKKEKETEEEEEEEPDEETPKYAKKLLSQVENLQKKIDDLEEKGKIKEKKAALQQQLDLLLDSQKLTGKTRNVVARLTLMNVSLGNNTEDSFKAALAEFKEAAGHKRADPKDPKYVKEKLKDGVDTEVETGESGTDTGIERKKPFTAEDLLSGKLRQALVNRAKMKA